MTASRGERWLRRLCRTLMRLYPEEFRNEFGRELEDAYVRRMEADGERGVAGPWLRTALLMIWHSMRDGTLERMEARKTVSDKGKRAPLVDTFLQDIRHSFRNIRKKPSFYGALFMVFALGIGANTVIFSVVNGVVLRPLPYPEPDRLVVPWQTHPHWLESDNPALRAQWDHLGLAYPVFEDWLEMNPVFDDLGIYAFQTFIATGTDQPERIPGARATRGVFSALGVKPLLGRTFSEEEDRMGGERVVVLSHGVWQERFGSDPTVLGRTMILDEVPHTIVGVMPRGFDFPNETRLWTPLRDSDREQGRNSQFARSVARLKPGTTLASAQREMEALQARLNEIHPIPGRNYGFNLESLHEETVGESRSALLLLLGVVGGFLAIACANTTNLLLLRASERKQELAVRLSLGAGRKRILRQLLTEGLVISGVGGGMGLFLAYVSLPPFLSLLPPGTPRLDEVTLDGRVLVLALLVSMAAGALVSVIPGILASGTHLTAVLKTSARGALGSRRRNRTQMGILVAEVALTFVLLMGAGLLVRSFAHLTSVDPGFNPQGIVMMRMDLRGERYASMDQRRQVYEELRSRLSALPGVTEVAVASPGPFRNWWSNGTTVDTRRGLVETNTQQEEISANYFEAIGVPILAGRTFSPDEMEEQAPVALVNRSLADSFWPGEGAVGQRIKLGSPENDTPWLTVIGVVGDVRRRLEGEPYATIFHPVAYRNAAVVIRTTRDAATVMTRAREALRAVDPHIPIASLDLLEEEINRTVAGPRVRTVVLGIFAAFSSFLAVVGIFGLLAYAVAQQRGEIGLRMALGAEKPDVMRGILGRGLTILALGMTMGILITLAAGKALEPFLFHLESTDPATLIGVTLLLTVATLGASLVPARRAMRVDPVVALRADG